MEPPESGKLLLITGMFCPVSGEGFVSMQKPQTNSEMPFETKDSHCDI